MQMFPSLHRGYGLVIAEYLTHWKLLWKHRLWGRGSSAAAAPKRQNSYLPCGGKLRPPL